MKTIGVIIARFQSPYLHEGHKALVGSVRTNHNKTVVVLGVSPVRGSRKNPLDYHTRETMIKKIFSDVMVLPLSDHPEDAKWSQNLDELLANAFPGSMFTLYGSRDSFISCYSGQFELVELPKTGFHSATLIRDQISDKVLDSDEFRTGVIYAYSNMYVKVWATVDVAMFRKNKSELLLGKKNIDNKWRLLGGFSDVKDESYEETARRELTEECGLVEITEMKYEKSFRVQDWRYKSEEDKIITCLFSTDFINGDPKGQADIAEVKWFPLTEVAILQQHKQTAEEHGHQLDLLLKKYGAK